MSIYHTWILQGHSILSINLLAWPIMRSYRAETRDPGDGSARVDEGGLGLPVGKGWCFSFLSWRILVGCWLLVGLEGGILRGLLNSFWFFAGGNNIHMYNYMNRIQSNNRKISMDFWWTWAAPWGIHQFLFGDLVSGYHQYFPTPNPRF